MYLTLSSCHFNEIEYLALIVNKLSGTLLFFDESNNEGSLEVFWELQKRIFSLVYIRACVSINNTHKFKNKAKSPSPITVFYINKIVTSCSKIQYTVRTLETWREYSEVQYNNYIRSQL